MSTDRESIPFREHEIAMKVRALEERADRVDDATKLQAAEYERRLSELNHAHEKQVKDQATYVSEDKYNGFISEYSQWRDGINNWKAQQTGLVGGSSSLRDLVFRVVAVLVPLIALVIVLWRLKP